MAPTVAYTILICMTCISVVMSEEKEKKTPVFLFNFEPTVLEGRDFNPASKVIEEAGKVIQPQESPEQNVYDKDFKNVLKSIYGLVYDTMNDFNKSETLVNHDELMKGLRKLKSADKNLEAFIDGNIRNKYEGIEHILSRNNTTSNQFKRKLNVKPQTSDFLSIDDIKSPSEQTKSNQRQRRNNDDHRDSQKPRREAKIEEDKMLQESLLNITARIARHGYISREYTVETEDGYLLGLQRIRTKTEGGRKTPILLMHGLLLSAACWLDGGPKTGLAYLLADAGHDVWLANARGSYYSRKHVTLDPDSSSDYWQFSGDEIGKYDLPANIDKVLNVTGAEKLNYIGFSQGGGTFLMMCSELPHYCLKANIIIGIAPSARHLLTKSPVFRKLSEFYEKNEKTLFDLGNFEVLPKNGLVQKFFSFLCRRSDFALQICELVKDIFDSHHPGSFTKESIINMASNFPSGTSVHNMARFGQSMRAKTFHKFDYGRSRNLQLYGSSRPPNYNLNAVTVPVVVIYGRNDGIVDIGDVKWLVQQLPNVVESFEVEDPLWTHMDVTYSKYVPKLLYPKIEQYLNIFK